MGVCNQMTDKNNHISDKSTSTIRPNWHLHLKPSVHPVQSYTLELVLPICTCRSLQNSFLREANCMKIKNSIQRYCSPLFFFNMGALCSQWLLLRLQLPQGSIA